MTARPKVEIVNYGDPDHVAIFVDGKEVGEAYNDRTADSRTAVQKVTDVARELARTLGADVVDADEPTPQLYTYFVTFSATERASWRRPLSVLLHSGTVTAGSWFELDRPIEGVDDTQRIAEYLAARYPTPTVVLITGFTYVDGPS